MNIKIFPCITIMTIMLSGCTSIEYVVKDIPEASENTLESCKELEEINFKENETVIDVASKLLDERKLLIDCKALNESKRDWILKLESLNIKK